MEKGSSNLIPYNLSRLLHLLSHSDGQSLVIQSAEWIKRLKWWANFTDETDLQGRARIRILMV